MSRKSFAKLLVAACLIMVPAITRATTTVSSGDISITGTVDQFAEWATAPAIATTDFNGHINTVNQTRTAHADLTLYSNIAVTIAATTTSGSPDFSGILTDSSHTYTLATQYKITGGAVTPTTPGFLDPVNFFDPTNTYALAHTPGTGAYTVTLTVTMASPAASAPEAGDYTCGLALTASW